MFLLVCFLTNVCNRKIFARLKISFRSMSKFFTPVYEEAVSIHAKHEISSNIPPSFFICARGRLRRSLYKLKLHRRYSKEHSVQFEAAVINVITIFATIRCVASCCDTSRYKYLPISIYLYRLVYTTLALRNLWR